MTQTAVALGLVLFAVIYLALQIYRFFKLRQRSRCGGCRHSGSDTPPPSQIRRLRRETDTRKRD